MNQTFEELQSEYKDKVEKYTEHGYDTDEAHLRGYKEMYRLYRDQLSDHYLREILWYQDMNKDPIHKKIKNTAKRLREEDDYETKESWQYAVKKRKYLFDNVLDSYNPPPTEDNDDAN